MSGAAEERIANEITWRWSLRRDLSVARLLMGGAEVDGVYGISAATIVDRLFCWLETLGLWDRLGSMKGEGVQRQVIAYGTYITLYFIRCLARIGSQNSLPTYLFSDMALMNRLGFNAQVLQEGITHRGDRRREGPRRNLPLDPEAMSKNIVKLRLPDVRDFVRWVLKAIWANIPVVPKKLLGAIDGSFIEVGPSAKGAGRASRNRKVRTKEGLKEVTETIFGFKMIWLWVPAVGLPLAVAFGTAEVDERKFVEGLLRDAREVLGDRGKLGTVVVDRGFLSGAGLWALKEAEIRFVIPARHNLRVYEEARRVAVERSVGWKTHPASRTRPAKGRAAKREGGEATWTTEVVGVEGCRSFETYAPAENVEDGEHKGRYRKDFKANRVNAVVLMREDGRVNADLVLLTNGPVDHPFIPLDDYDDRSLIENQGHREMKQRWFLESPVQRTAKAAEIHVLFVVLAYAVTQAFRLWEEAQIRQEVGGRSSTLGEYVRKLEKENFDKIIVFVGEEYGIYHASELAMLCGTRVKKPNPKGASNLEELMSRLEKAEGT